jgi:predicted DNA-binding protein with PD1-like motif
MRYRAEPNGYIIKLSIDDEIGSSLIEFGRQERIDSAHFWGIGAAKDIVLGSYDLQLKTYRKAELAGIWEIASLTGSLARTEDGPILHIHGVFSDEDCTARGGHVFTLACAATVEIFLVALSPGLVRRYDEVTGLKLLDL